MKGMYTKILIMIFGILVTFVPVTTVEAAGEDGFGLDGKSFAIITKDTMVIKDANNKVIEESHLALTDSYNDEYHTDLDVEYNLKRIGGKKLLKEDLDCANALVNCEVKDNAVTLWHFEINEEMREKSVAENNNYDSNGNGSSRYVGNFKWYNIYTIDESGNKRYLNLNFGGESGYKVEISDNVEPVAVLKRSNGEGYMLWGHNTYDKFLDNVVNILIPTRSVNNVWSLYNFGLFGGSASYNEGDLTRIFVLAEQGFDNKELTSTPKVVQNNTSFSGEIKLFNYNSLINFEGAGVNGFRFYNSNNPNTPLQIAKDGYGETYSRDAVGSNTIFDVEPLLGSDGYPVTSLGSLNYLFNEDETNGKTIAGTNIDAGSLFQIDNDGYFYYDSVKNATYFDGEKFVLYDAIVRPEYTPITGISSSGLVNYASDERKGNFLPFNKIDETTLSAYDVANTTTGLSSYKLTGKNEGVVDLWFGMTMENSFYMPKDGLVDGKDMTFSFSGDDFVLVYVDGALVLRFDEVNKAEKAYINFKTGEIVDSYHESGDITLGKVLLDAGVDTKYVSGDTLSSDEEHTIKFFYVEQGGNLSYFNLNTNLYQNVIVENPSTGVNIYLDVIVLTLIILGTLTIVKKTNKFNKLHK